MRFLKTMSLTAVFPVAAMLSFCGLACADDFIVGACTHFAQGKGIMTENINMLKQTGVVSLRDEIYWCSCEESKGSVRVPDYATKYIETALDNGISPLLILSYGNGFYDKGGYPKSVEAIDAYAKYAETVAAAFKGKVKWYQVWNEWDETCGKHEFRGQGDAPSYVKLAAATYSRIKSADPQTTVLATSISHGEKYVKELIDAGILKYCDAISFHSYQYNMPLEKRSPEAYVERIAGIDKIIRDRNGGKDFPLYLTETGCPTHTKKFEGATAQESGDYIARAFLLVKSIPSVKGIWWYDFQDDGLNPEYSEANFGLVKTDLTPKESYYVLRSIAEIVNKGKFIERVKTTDNSLYLLKFKMPDGRDVLAAWSVAEDCNTQITLKNTKGNKGKLSTFLAGFDPIERNWGMREWASAKSAWGTRAPFVPNGFQFSVRSRPFIVMGDLTGVEIASVARIAFPDVQRQRDGFVKVPQQISNVYPADKPGIPIKFGGPKNYRSITNGAPFTSKDLDAQIVLSWRKDTLKFVVEVIDDQMFQKNTGADAWQGDSIQVAIQNFAKDANPKGWTEYILALTDNGPAIYRESSQTKLPATQKTQASLTVKREGVKTVYTAEFPVSELGIKMLAPEMILGFSILVNDNDGTGRKGYLRWGDGIGNGKNPSEFNWIIIKE